MQTKNWWVGQLHKRRADTRTNPHTAAERGSEPSTLTKQKKETKPWNHEQKPWKYDYWTHQKLEIKVK